MKHEYEPETVLLEQSISFWKPEYAATKSKIYETAAKRGLFIVPLTHNLGQFRNMYAIQDMRIPMNSTIITDFYGLESFVFGGIDGYLGYCEMNGISSPL